MEERRSLDMGTVSRAIQKSQVLTIHGQDDKTIPYTDALEFDKLVKHHQVHIIKDANHNFTDPQHAEELIQVAIAFITAQ